MQAPTPTPDGNRIAAFFDLDRTLLRVNSGRLWAERERRLGRIGTALYLQAIGYLVLYQFGLVDIERVLRKALATVRGISEEQVRQWTREWFFSEVAPLEAPAARAVIEAHRHRHHLLVLLTSSSPYASECAVELFNLDMFISMQYEIRDGHFTGDFVAPACFGSGKVARAAALAAQQGIDLHRSYFYSDSSTDLPMLLSVGHPRVVNPDWRLRWQAWRLNWPVLDWSRAQPAPPLSDD